MYARLSFAVSVGLFLAGGSLLFGQSYGSGAYYIVDFAGDSIANSPVPATSVSIGNPTGITADAAGNVFIAGPSIIFKLDPSGMLTRFAGSGHNGSSGDGGAAIRALLGFPRAYAFDAYDFFDVVGGLSADSFGNLYIADFLNSAVRKVTPDGSISTVAGNGKFLSTGFGQFGSNNGGQATNAAFGWPSGVAADSTGAFYLTDTYETLWRVAPGGVITAAIGNNCGGSSSPGVCVPYGLATDATGNVYVADTANCRVLKILPDGTSNSIAGILSLCDYAGDGAAAAQAVLNKPYGVAADLAGNVYIADTYNNCIRKVTPDGNIATFAGICSVYMGPFYPSGGYSGDGGPATSALLNLPHGVAVDGAGNVYIADTENFAVRKVTPDGTISTVAGNGIFCCNGGSPQ
jgi:NHL repeat-containing protein